MLQDISVLPGRIRLRDHSLYHNKLLSRYINIYIDNLHGVKYSTVNRNTASILVVYDPLKTNDLLIRKNIGQAISSALKNKPEKIREYDEYDKVLEKRDIARRDMVIYGLAYLALKIKNSVYGKFALSTSAGVLEAAAVLTIVGGYPLIKRIYNKTFGNAYIDMDMLLNLASVGFTLARESAKGVLLQMLKAMNDNIKCSAEAQCHRLLNQSMNRTAETAWLVSSSGQEVLVGLDTLKPDDVINVHEGEVIPVQGEVIDGSALIDMLHYIGQPITSMINKGNRVHHGASVLSGNLAIKVENIPEKRAKPLLEKEKMQIHKRVEGYQKRLTPVSLVLGLAGHLLSGKVMNALAILLAFTPSGSGTALSTGMKSYITLLNKHGIFARSPATFENVTNVDHIVFDKTGTLTQGRMKLEHIESFNNNYAKEELLKICAGCESEHYHPISLSLQEEGDRYADIRKVSGSVLIPSRGVKASYDGHTVLIGNKMLMDESGIGMDGHQDLYTDFEKRLLTPILVSIDGTLAGIIVLGETLKEGSSELINRIKQKHAFDLSLLTGDNDYKSQEIAQRLGINNVYSNCSYEDKVAVIHRLKDSDTVMMVGDGINDIDAMREADISVSFANSSYDQVKLNSDYIIFEDHMLRLADMISLSRRAYREIHRSITVSQLLNVISGGLAFFGTIDAFAAKSINTVNSLLVLGLNKRIEYLGLERQDKGTSLK